MTSRFNHAFTFGFSVESAEEDAGDITAAAVRIAIRTHLSETGDDELLENCSAPFNTCRLDEPKPQRRQPKPRTRAGSWRTFERRFAPRLVDDHCPLVDLHKLPKDIDPHLVWTVTDDDGRFYLNPGYRFVNRFAYVICAKPWSADDEQQPPYLYD